MAHERHDDAKRLRAASKEGTFRVRVDEALQHWKAEGEVFEKQISASEVLTEKDLAVRINARDEPILPD